ncbi:MAG: YtxH domain-containing protein [Chloroflexota bacterium]
MSEHEDGGSFALGLLIGGAIGIAVGLLCAPRAGEETRELLRERAEEVTEKARETLSELKKKAQEKLETSS